jgi:hemerythrin-like domain-containing protein
MDVLERETAPVDQDDRSRAALLDLLRHLDGQGYRFVTATPGTHTRVLARADRRVAANVRAVRGWSLPFERDVISPALFDLLERAGVLDREGDRFKATVRVSSVQDTLFLHSAFPTLAEDSVFLGPDSYRFADLILARMGELAPGARVMDYAAGTGVGGITAARAAPGARLTLADINPKALRLAAVNAEFAGLDHREVEANSPADVDGPFDLIVTHPPFMMDEAGRKYRDGGDLYGARLSLDWVVEGVELLNEGGRLVLHTGVSIVGGRDVLLDELRERIDPARFEFGYHELDPDIFSEDLDTPPYAEVERIAAVGLWITRRAARDRATCDQAGRNRDDPGLVDTTSNRRSEMATKHEDGPTGGGRTLAIGAAAGLTVGLLANLLRKAAVQGPTVAAGSWDEALAAEHKAALAIFDLIEKTDDRQAGRRSFLLMQLKHAIGKHAFAEENSVYAQMRDLGMTEGADHLNHEHGYVKQYFFELSEMSKSDPAWLPKLREFHGYIRSHMRDEEEDLFPRLRGMLSEAQNKHLTTAMNREGLKLA